MANRFPLIIDTANSEIRELPSGDNLDLTGNGITAVRSIIPEANNTYDLGTADLRWNALYVSGNTIFIGEDGEISFADGVVTLASNGVQANVDATTLGGENKTYYEEYAANASNIDNGTLGATFLADSGVAAATYGNTTSIPVLTIDAKGRITEANTINITDLSTLTYDSNTGQISIGTADSETFTANLDLVAFDTDGLEEGNTNLYYTEARVIPVANTVVHDQVPGIITSNVTTTFVNGLNIDADTVDGYEASALLDFTNATNKPDPTIDITLTGEATGTGNTTLTDLANGSITIDVELSNTTVTAGTYGSASLVPVITVDEDGRLTNASTVSVAGVANVEWYSANNTLVINTADGGSYPITIEDWDADTVTIANAAIADLVVSGNLTVSGTTTTVNTEEVNIADNIINLNSNVDGNTDPTEDGGISINRGSNSDVTLVWDESEDYWTVGTEKFVAGDLQGTLPWSNVSSTPSPNVSITVDGDVEGSGTAELTNLGTDAEITVTLELTNTGVTAGEYGNASSVPVITVDEDGRVTNASEVSVAGVANIEWYSANNTLQINTADGGNFPITIQDWDADTVTIANAEIEDLFANNFDVTTINRDPNITVTLDGDVEGTANTTLTNLANGSITITTDLSNTGVTAGEYGNASSVPVITVDEDGRITNASEVSVAGVSNVEWYSANNTLQINTADGGNYPVTIEDWDADTVTIANAEIEDLFANNFDVTTINRDPNITVTLSGDLSGAGNTTLTNLANGSITITANVNGVQENSIALGTDTTGNYVSDVTGTANQIDITHTPDEGSSPQVGLANDVTIAANLTVTAAASANTLEIANYIDLANVDHPTHSEGRFFYDDVHKTLNFNNDITNLQFELGTNEYIRVYNDTSNTIPNGAALFLNGYTATDPVVPKAQLADASSAATYNISGLAAASIAAGAYGYCAVSGVVRGSNTDPFDTSGLTAGVRAFVSATTPGGLQQPSPKYPNYPMCVGLVVVSDATEGVFVVEQQMHAVPQFRVAGDVYVGADLTVAGDLSVLGTETTTTLTNISVADTFFYLGTGDTISNTVFTGTGLNDALYQDYYNGTETKTYSVRIDGVGTGTGGVDTFEWSVDNFATTEATGVDITAEQQLLEDHIKIKFEATTGHTSGDRWDGDVAPSNLDFGISANYSNSTLYSHAGFFRDASDDRFKFFKRYDPEVEGSVDVSNSSFQYADIEANSFFGHTITANVIGNVTGTVSDISNHSNLNNITLSGTTNVGSEMVLTSNSTVSQILHTGGILDTLRLGANNQASVFIRGGSSNPSVGIGVEQGIHNLAVKGNLAVNNSIMIGDSISNLQSGSAGSLSAFEVYTQGAQSGYIEGRGTTAAFTVASNGAYFSSLEASANGQGQVALYHYRDTTILAPSYAANGDSALSSTGTLNITGTDGTVVRGDFEVTGRSKFSVEDITVSAVGTTDLDVGATDNFHITMQANTTFTVSNLADKIGGSGTIVIIQDANGGREFTLASEMKTPVNGATISQSTGANEVSVISYYVVSSSQMLINYIGDFA